MSVHIQRLDIVLGAGRNMFRVGYSTRPSSSAIAVVLLVSSNGLRAVNQRGNDARQRTQTFGTLNLRALAGRWIATGGKCAHLPPVSLSQNLPLIGKA